MKQVSSLSLIDDSNVWEKCDIWFFLLRNSNFNILLVLQFNILMAVTSRCIVRLA